MLKACTVDKYRQCTYRKIFFARLVSFDGSGDGKVFDVDCNDSLK